MAIPQHHKQYLDLIARAAMNGDLALVEGQCAETGDTVTMICAMAYNNGEFVMTPLGNLPKTDNPYDAYCPPNPEGGFFKLEEAA